METINIYYREKLDSLDKIIGQDNIIQIIKNQLKTKQFGHTYLLFGPKGSGKTTVARIFAKALSCINLEKGYPCNECIYCLKANNNSLDIIELDAASNNGVDDIRILLQDALYFPTELKYKVYILDEVHMLSIGACNALLKILENPPMYIIFLLVTTDPYKLPITILSRCMQLPFNKIKKENIIIILQNIISKDKLKYIEKKAVERIAKIADGSARDAISFYDLCKDNINMQLTYKNVLERSSIIFKEELIEEIINIIDEKNNNEVKKEIINKLICTIDIINIATCLIECFNDLLYIHIIYTNIFLLSLTEEELLKNTGWEIMYSKILLAISKTLCIEKILEFIEELNNIGKSIYKAQLLETFIFKLILNLKTSTYINNLKINE